MQGTTGAEIAAELARFADSGTPGEHAFVGRTSDRSIAVGFLFSGQGPQWHGMARRLLEAHATFRSMVEAIDALLGRLGWLGGGSSLLAELTKGESRSRMGETEVAQPAIFAVQMGLTSVLAEHGVRPAAVLGHSIGELAAAATAGILSLAEATRIVYCRSRCQAMAEGKGAMAAVGIAAADARKLLEPYDGQIEIAAVNGPSSVTVAGETAAIEELLASLARGGMFTRRLNVSVPFHCRLMDPIEHPFKLSLGMVDCRADSAALLDERTPFHSSVTARRMVGDELTADYWYRNIRRPVLFYPALSALLDAGLTQFIEISPHTVLSRDVLAAMGEQGISGNVHGTLDRNADDETSIANLIARLFCAGVAVDADPRPRAAVPFVALPRHPFIRQRYWNEPFFAKQRRLRPGRAAHPHIASIEISAGSARRFHCDLAFDARTEPYLADHLIQGAVIVPGAAQVEAISAAAAAAGCFAPESGVLLEDVVFDRALVLAADTDVAQFRLEVTTSDGHFGLSSRRTDEGHVHSEWLAHTRGRIGAACDLASPATINIAELRSRMTAEIHVDEMYAAFAESGLILGPAFRGITAFWANDNEALSRVELSDGITGDVGSFLLHLVVLDCMLQSAGALCACSIADGTPTIRRALFVPYRAECCQVATAANRPRSYWCHARRHSVGEEKIVFSVSLFDAGGCRLAALTNVVGRRVRGASDDGKHFYRENWESKPLERDRIATDESGTWLVLGSQNGCCFTAAVSRALTDAGADVLSCTAAAGFRVVSRNQVEVCPHASEDYKKMARSLARRIAGIVHLWNIQSGQEPDANGLERALMSGPIAMSHLIAALDENAAWAASPRIVFLTCRAQNQPDHFRERDALAGPLLGDARVLLAERADMRVRAIDIADASPEELSALAGEVFADSTEPEVALRGAERNVRTIERLSDLGAAPQRAPDASEWVTAVQKSPGVVDRIQWRGRGKPRLGPDDVEIEVRAAGLNFKDVALATGLIAADAFNHGFTGDVLGMDCSGLVAGVGANVPHIRVGDEVMAVAREALASRAVASRWHVALKPKNVSFAQSASLPIVFLTAKIAIDHIARLRPDETILIHSAAGGVGAAAMQVALRRGARVIATAGKEEKRNFALRQGACHVFDSRSPGFRRRVLDVTGGVGVDVILNSLSAEMLREGLRILAPFGRFIEIGKTDIQRSSEICLAALARNRSYHVLDIDELILARGPDVQTLLSETVAQIEVGELAPPPLTTFSAAELSDAFRYMTQGRHIGKVVIDMAAVSQREAIKIPTTGIRCDGVYVISGGTRGYGLATAEWLVGNGARTIALLGSSGAIEPDAQAVLDRMKAAGANTVIHRCDVTSLDDVSAVFTELERVGPVRGIVHAATMLDDAPISAMTADRFRAVVGPKAIGALNLHFASREFDLDFFLMFSSIASALGTPGQANYAAGNAFLDSFAGYLRGKNVRAYSINWGVLDEVGLVARAPEKQRRKILSQGIGAFRLREAMAILDSVLAGDEANVIAARVDWSQLRRRGAARQFPWIDRFAGKEQAALPTALRDEIRSTLPERQPALLAEAILEQVAKITGGDRTRFDAETPFDRIGIDSLSAVQLMSWLDAAIGVSVPVMQILGGSSARRLARSVLESMDASISQAATSTSSNEDAVVRRLHWVDAPRLRIFCFPYAGGGAEAFVPWCDLAPDDVEIYAIEPPTLAARDSSVLNAIPDAIYGWIYERLAPLLDVPCVLYGHSVGGWLALGVAQTVLQRKGAQRIAAIGIGAVPTPEFLGSFMPGDLAAPDDICGEDLARAFSALRMRDDQSARTVDVMKRDLWLGSRANVTRLSVPGGIPSLWIFGGAGDPLPTIDKTAGEFIPPTVEAQIEMFDGGHLFIHDPGVSAALFAKLVTAATERVERSESHQKQ